MAQKLIDVEGIEECCADLLRVKATVCGLAIAKGLAAAGAVIEEEVRQRTPVYREELVAGGGGGQSTSAKEYGLLIDDLKTQITLDAGYRGGFAEIGFRKLAYIANFLEFGHRMVGHGKSKERRGGLSIRDFGIGQVPANPFMRTAADVAAERAIAAFIGRVDETIKELA